MEEMIKALAQALRSARVRYVVIGGIAASVWGRPRLTLDVDAVITVPLDRLPHLLEALAQAGFQVPQSAIRRLKAMLPAKLRFGKRLSLDLRVASYGLDKQALARATPVKIFDTRLPIASREDIIVYKVARFNELDQADIKSILLRWKKKLDLSYLVQASQKLGEETGDEHIVANANTVLDWPKGGL